MKNKYTVKCNVTGIDLIRTPKYLREQIQKYGFNNADEFRNQYIGREGRKLLKEGKSIEEIRSQYKCDLQTPISQETLIRFKIKKGSGSTVLRRSEEKPTLKKVDSDNQPF